MGEVRWKCPVELYLQEGKDVHIYGGLLISRMTQSI